MKAQSALRPVSDARPCYRIRLIGPVSVEYGGVPLDVASWPHKAAALLAMLAASTDFSCSRDDVVQALWPEALPDAAASNLRRVVHHLRRAMEGGNPLPIVLRRDRLALHEAYIWQIDIARFRELTADLEGDIARLEEAAGLVGPEPFVEFRYEDWASPYRDAYVAQVRDLLSHLTTHYVSVGDLRAAERCIRQALELDPLDEDAMRRWMELQGARGRRAEARRAYRQFKQRLQNELGVEPEAATAAVALKLEHASVRPQPASGTLMDWTEFAPTYMLTADGPLVGRERERQVILEALEGRGPGLILIGAEAGMGKTRLLTEVASLARSRGGAVLAGGCYEQEGRLTYGAIHDALQDALRAQPPEVLREQLGDLLPQLSRIVPAIIPDTIQRLYSAWDPQDPSGQRLQLLSAVAQTLDRLAQKRQVVLLVDDLHWADESTVQMLHYLARQTCRGVVIVAAYRSGEVRTDSCLSRWIEEVGEIGRKPTSAHLLSLSALSVSHIGDILRHAQASPCPADLAGDLTERSGGNPFFAQQLYQSLVEQGGIQRAHDGDVQVNWRSIAIPARIRQTIEGRFRRLNAGVRDTLQIAAAVGRSFPYRVLEDLCHDERELAAALDLADAAAIIAQTDDGYVFRHPLLREVLYDSIPLPRRPRMHARIGLALRELYGASDGAHVAELAYHFSFAGPEYSRIAVSYLRQAGDAALAGMAWTEAAEYYRRAVALGGESNMARLQERLADALRNGPESAEALDLWERAAAQDQDDGDVDSVARVVAKIGHWYFDHGKPQQGLERLLPLASALDRSSPSTGLSLLHSACARLSWAVNRIEEANPHALRAIELAETCGDSDALIQGRTWYGLILSVRGQHRAASAVLESVVEQATSLGTEPYIALILAGESRFIRGEFCRAREFCERVVHVGRKRGPASEAFALANLAEINFHLGQWDKAMVHARHSVDLVCSNDLRWSSLYGSLQLAVLYAARGEWAEARPYMDDVMRLAERTLDDQAQDAVRMLEARRVLGQGQPESALRFLEPAASRKPYQHERQLRLLPLLAEAHLSANRAQLAASLLDAGVTRAREQGHVLALGQLLLIRGMVHVAQHEVLEAGSALNEALALSRSMPWPHLEARVSMQLGELTSRDGAQAATELRHQALAIFERLGAHEDANVLMALSARTATAR